MPALKNLLNESKKYQVLRFLNLMYGDAKHQRATDLSNDLSEKLRDKIKDSKEFYHFIDLIVKIESWHQLFSPTQNRDFSSQRPIWKKINSKLKSLIHPLYIFICSSFNDEIDSQLRAALQIKITGKQARIEPISYYVFGKILFHNAEINLKADKYFSLLFFQLKSADLIANITDTDKFFKQLGEWNNLAGNWKASMFGLLRGDIEGFILFSSDHPNEDKILMDYLQDGFNDKIAPITLYFGVLESTPVGGEENLNILKDISVGYTQRK